MQVGLTAVLAGQPRLPRPGEVAAQVGELAALQRERHPTTEQPHTGDAGERSGPSSGLGRGAGDGGFLITGQVVEQRQVRVEAVALGREVPAAQVVEVRLGGLLEER